ncbi:EAL domain-containing protein, partial [bacterium AH-315-K03]|nr:EAL domain-containing protein [bacterium AH-315-K03]
AIQSLSKKPISLSQSKSIEVSASLGVFTYPQEDIAIKNPIRAAETAMARAKKQSKGSTEYFSIDWMKQLRARRSQEEQLLEAFNNNQLKAHYQPILSGETGEFVGLEALVRWQHPQKGLITPDLFLPLATKLGLMPRLGKFMLRQACKDIQTLRQSGIKIQWMSVNLSAEQLYNLHLAQEVENALKEFDIPNNIIELEIVEELISQDSELVQSQLNAIAKLGVSLSIDDFGTGFSSLSRLKHLPVSKLKIDKSFVDGLPDSEDDQCIVRSIIGLARGMNLSVVAEGVETSPQAQWLIERGCDFLQGYFYSKPVEFDKLKEILCEKTNKQNPIKGTYHIETRGNMLLIQVKGSWDTALALEFFDTIHQHLKSMKKQAWGTLLDTREWNPTSLKVQKETTGKIQQLIKKGLRCSAYIVNDSELVKFQLEKMAPSFNDYKRKYFNNKDSAAQWLSKEGFEIT